MSILKIVGKIVKRSPNFIKRFLEKTVFIDQAEHLPEPKPNSITVAIVFGGSDARVQKSIEIYQRGIVDYFLTSGGIGPLSINREKAEAELFAEDLIAAGVPDCNIWIENDSVNTTENVKFSMNILLRKVQEHPATRLNVILITSGYHLKRTRTIYEKTLINACQQSSAADMISHAYWATSPCPNCERSSWRNSERSCALVAKEALHLILW